MIIFLFLLTVVSECFNICLFLYLINKRVSIRHFLIILFCRIAYTKICNSLSWKFLFYFNEEIFYLLLSFFISRKPYLQSKLKIFNALLPTTLNNISFRVIIFFIFPLFGISVETIKVNYLIAVSSSFLTILLSFLLIKLFKESFGVIQKRRLAPLISKSIIIADIIMIAYTFTQQYLVYLENTTHTSTLIIRKLIVVIYLVLFFIMLIFLDRNIRATIQSQLDFQKDIQLSHLKNYNKQIEKLYQSVRSFRHDYANILTTLKLGIEQNDIAIVKEVYDSVLKDSDKHLKSKTFDLTRLINIEDNTIKSLLAAKFLEAEENNIDVSLDIPETIKLEGMEMVDFITVISIFLDNAMEASIQSDIPKMHIGYFNHGNKQLFIVQNSTREEFISITSLFERGVSSKEGNRGIGLANVRNILDNYQNISLKTESMTFAFTQELNISKKA